MHKLRYLRVSHRILERIFYESAQSNGVEQYSEQSRKPLSQQWILKKAKRLIYHRCIVSDLPSNLLKCFLLVTFPYMTDIYTQRTTKLFTPIIKSFIALKVLIQNERTRWLQRELYIVRLYRVLSELDTLSLFLCYELLVCYTVLVTALLESISNAVMVTALLESISHLCYLLYLLIVTCKHNGLSKLNLLH